MATLPNTYARRPTPRFGGAERAAPIVESGDIALGQGIQALGKGMGDYLIRAKAKQDQIALEDYTTRAKAKAFELRREYEQKKGADAAQDDMFFSGTMEKFEGVRKELLSEVKDADVHKALEQRLELAEINFQEGLINHITTEGEVYGDQVYESGVGLGQTEMGEFWYDDNQMMQARNDIKRHTDIQAQKKGIPLNSPVYKKMLEDNLTTGHVNAIKAMVVVGNNPQAASDYFEDFSDEIAGDFHDDIQKLIKSSGTARRTQQAVDGYIADGLTRTEAQAQARKDFTDEDRDAAVLRVEARYNEIDNADNKYQTDTFNGFLGDYEALMKEGDITPTDAYDILYPKMLASGLDGDMIHKMRRIAQADTAAAAGTSRKTNWPVYFSTLKNIKNNQSAWRENPQWLAVLTPELSDTEMRRLETKIFENPETLISNEQRIDDALWSFGINPEWLEEEGDDGDKARAFRRYIEDSLPFEWGPDELDKAIEDSKRKILMGDGVFNNFFGERVPIWELGMGDELPGVDKDWLPAIHQTLIDLGLPQDEEHIYAIELVRRAKEPLTVPNIESVLAKAEQKIAAQKAAAAVGGTAKDVTRQKVEGKPAQEYDQLYEHLLITSKDKIVEPLNQLGLVQHLNGVEFNFLERFARLQVIKISFVIFRIKSKIISLF